eukprot:403374137
MNSKATQLLTLLISLGLISANLIVDREFDKNKIAEGIPLTVKYTFYNTFSKDVLNLELIDNHFSNASFYQPKDAQHVRLSIASLPQKEKVVREVQVTPVIEGEHTFEAAIYSYQMQDDESQVRFTGVTTNKPKALEIASRREYVLQQETHSNEWIVFLVLSIISVSLPFVMWRSARNSRIAKTEEQQSTSNQSSASNDNSGRSGASKKQKRN